MSDSHETEGNRRDFLYYATAGAGAITTGAAVWPLINQMNPSADVKALASIRVDVSGVEPGTQLTLRTFHIGGTATRIIEQSEMQTKRAGTVKFSENLADFVC